MNNEKKTILLDLDGVLNTYKSGDYQEDYIPPVREGAIEFVKKLSENYTIKIFTTRNNKQALNWLNENSMNNFISEVTNIKEPAWLFIDDRCICFDGTYNELNEKINNFRVWNENS